MPNTLELYGYAFPDLLWDIMSYYSDMSVKSKFIRKEYGVNPDTGCKVPLDFCEHFRNKYNNLEHTNIMIQPHLISDMMCLSCQDQNDIFFFFFKEHKI